MPGRFALIVATDTYADPKLRRLRAPARDAEALAGVLRDPEIGAFEVELASNESDAALRRRIAAFFSDRARDSLLLLHFSCHGLKDDSGQLYFAAADTEVAHLDATAIPAEFVSRQMARSRSSNVLMLLDCCYSGAIARGLRFRAGESVDVNDHLGGSGRAIITASNAMEYAFEGDELTGEGRPSVFTSAVVKALETGEADRDQDSWISVRELYDYVCDAVRDITPDQRPNMLSHLEGELYVARSRWVAPATLAPELTDALANPIPSVREGAIHALAELLAGRDRGLAAAARQRLESVAADDDSRRVSTAAAAALASPPPAPAPPEPEPAAGAPPEPLAVAASAIGPEAMLGVSAPAAATTRIEWPLALVALAGALLILGWFLPWRWDTEPVPARDADSFDTDVRVAYAFLLVAGIAAIAAAAAAFKGRQWWPAWLAVTVLGAAAIGLVLSFVDVGSDGFDAGFFLCAAGAAVLLPAAAWRALSIGGRPAARVTAGDVIGAAGGVILVIGGAQVSDVLTSFATVPIFLAAATALAALATRALPATPGARPAALATAAAGPLAVGAIGMTNADGSGFILLGGVLALLGGTLAFRART